MPFERELMIAGCAGVGAAVAALAIFFILPDFFSSNVTLVQAMGAEAVAVTIATLGGLVGETKWGG